jgi:hypothetical protein
MSHDTDTIRPTAADAAAAPLDLLLTDIVVDPAATLRDAVFFSNRLAALGYRSRL